MDIQQPIDIEIDTSLCIIMKEVGSDAAGPFHNYTKLYSTIFEPVRSTPLRILEVGLAPNPDISDSVPAAAVRGWRRYFPNATVIGADPSAEYVVPVEGVSTYAYSWTDGSGILSIFEHEDTREPFDVIIYDGPGNPADKAVHFAVFVEHVREGGIIIIEDIDWKESVFWMNVKQRWDKAFPHFTWRPVSIPCRTHRGDNILMIAKVGNKAEAEARVKAEAEAKAAEAEAKAAEVEAAAAFAAAPPTNEIMTE